MKILLPIDGSDYSVCAAQFIASRTSLLGQKPELELFNVQRMRTAIIPELKKTAEKAEVFGREAEKAFDTVREILKAKGIDATEKMVVGSPAQAIADEVDRFRPDLVVMGARGISNFKKLFLGSVTTGVLARVTVPVLIIRGKHAPKHDSLKIGLAVDGSPYSEAAARYVAANMKLFGKKPDLRVINVVNVFDELAYSYPTEVPLPETAVEEKEAEKNCKELFAKRPELEKKAFDEALWSIRPIFEKAEIPVTEVCLAGEAGHEIAKYAKKKLDFLVMGNRGLTNLQSAVMGSVTARVIADGKVPLLIVPA